MSTRTVAIKLKIPDNEAYTAMTALRRLGVNCSKVERADVWTFEDAGGDRDFTERVERNESLFNPNKHELVVLPEGKPRAGEAWIEALRDSPNEDDLERIGRGIVGVSAGRHYVGWRLFADSHTPADAQTLGAAVEKLLCNPAIERAIL